MVNKCLERIPDEDIYPEAPSHITTYSNSRDSSDIYIKGPKFNIHNDLKETGIAAKLLLHEAEIFKHLAQHNQHPNFVRFATLCRSRSARVKTAKTGMAVGRCRKNTTLSDRFSPSLRKLDDTHNRRKLICCILAKLLTDEVLPCVVGDEVRGPKVCIHPAIS
jgi:hypothetical protein